MLIGLCGYSGSGKTCVAEYIQKHFQDRVEIFAFADALKDACVHIFCTERKHFDMPCREDVDSFWAARLNQADFSLRRGMQLFGDALRSTIHEKIFVFIMEKKIRPLLDKHIIIIIPDCRFAEEFEFIKTMGGIMVQINRPSLKTQIQDKKYTHSSEQHFKNFKVDLLLENDDGLLGPICVPLLNKMSLLKSRRE